jgi:RND family efflux transporter MFP subunit
MKKVLFAIVLLACGFAGGYLMHLRLTGQAIGIAHATKPARTVVYWYDPMHPAYRSDKPGIAPDCGMELVPMYSDGASGTGGAQAPAGTIGVSADKQQMIGVETGYAEMSQGVKTLRAVGRVAVDERRVTRVQSRTEGWIEKVNVDFTGRAVQQGETLLTFYSPEIVASEEEYLLALRAAETMKHASMQGMAESGDSLVSAARARLERHWRLDAVSLAELERTKKPVRSIPLAAPASGYVLTRNAYANMRVTPEMDLYTLADLRHVWILADVAEADAPQVRLGATATVEPSYAPGRKFLARVTNILPQMDPQTRTLKVRLEADNPGLTLRPDLFVNVEFRIAMPSRLSVPDEALIDTGNSQIVYIDRGSGVFEPRRVQIGERYDGRVEIVSGLELGERIALSGAFLLDSESRMRGVGAGSSSPAPASHAGQIGAGGRP